MDCEREVNGAGRIRNEGNETWEKERPGNVFCLVSPEKNMRVTFFIKPKSETISEFNISEDSR